MGEKKWNCCVTCKSKRALTSYERSTSTNEDLFLDWLFLLRGCLELQTLNCSQLVSPSLRLPPFAHPLFSEDIYIFLCLFIFFSSFLLILLLALSQEEIQKSHNKTNKKKKRGINNVCVLMVYTHKYKRDERSHHPAHTWKIKRIHPHTRLIANV